MSGRLGRQRPPTSPSPTTSPSLLRAYLRRHAYLILAACCACAAFAAVFALYTLPVEAVLYACVLAAACFLVIGAFRFAAFVRKRRALERMRAGILSGLEGLPAPNDALEADYQALLGILDAHRRALLNDAHRQRAEAADYYSLWAHQIKTPIAALGLLLQEREEDADTREMALQLLRIEQYVDMVLGYLRMDSPASDLVVARRPLAGIVRQAARKLSRLFIHTGTALEIADNLAVVLTDEKWLGFVVEQLLTNALKYAAGGRISIYMEDAGTLAIRDNGIGIAAEDLPRIFDMGYTGYNGRTGQSSTGIGLYLCKKVLDKLSHTIRVVSAPGAGATVYIGFNVTEV